jgi:hypothetical protein
MIRLNEEDLMWYQSVAHHLWVPNGASAAAHIFVQRGTWGLSAFHRAIVDRNFRKIQNMIDN